MIVSYLDGTFLGLDLSVADLAVVNHNGIPTGATGRAVGPTNALRELGIGIGQEKLFLYVSLYPELRILGKGYSTYNVVAADLVRLAPCAHDEGVVESQDGDNIHALLPELRQVLDVSGHMVHRTGRGESTYGMGVKLVPTYRHRG